MGKTVVVLGGSLGGLAVTHRLLKYTRPNEKDLKVILITKVIKPVALRSVKILIYVISYSSRTATSTGT